MLQEMLSKTDGKVGQVIYWGRPLDSKNQTLTPNPDALYFITFYNTKDGPIVLDLPPADDSGSFNANIVTVWQMPRGRRPPRHRQRTGRQNFDPTAGLQGNSARRLRGTAVRYVWRLHAVPSESQESQCC